MELKSPHKSYRDMKKNSSNRTFMELKYSMAKDIKDGKKSSNRTFMELKSPKGVLKSVSKVF